MPIYDGRKRDQLFAPGIVPKLEKLPAYPGDPPVDGVGMVLFTAHQYELHGDVRVSFNLMGVVVLSDD